MAANTQMKIQAFLAKLNFVKMPAPLRRRVFVIGVGVIVLLLVGYGFLPKAVIVDIAPATRGTFRVTIEEEGRTRVKDRFVVSAPVAGYLRRITLEVGDRVQKGGKVASLAPLGSTVLYPRSRAEAEAAVSASQASYDAAKERALAAAADAAYARERWERMQKLAANGYISKDDRDQAETENKKAEANRLSAEAAVAAAKADLEQALSILRYAAARGGKDTSEDILLRAPVNGTVLKLHRESEGVVNLGEPLLDIGNPRSLEVRADVLSSDAVRIKPGMTVLFERWGGDATLQGRVRVVEPAGFTKVSSLGVEEQRVLVIIDLTSPPEVWERLGDGYRLDATFVVWEGTNVLQVPASALFRKGEGWAVFVVAGRRARMREMEVGRRNGLQAEVLSGIEEGEIVVTHPDDSIRDSVKIKPR